MKILFEDAHLLAIDKPAGLSVEHGLGSHPSAEREAAEYLKKQKAGLGPFDVWDKKPPFVRVAHRLDRPTSGVLIFGKTKHALTDLMRQFENREIEKTYLARCQNAPSTEAGTLEHWLKRDETGKKALVFEAESPGLQRCALQFKLLKSLPGVSLLEIRPLTGRFHQIRAQLAHVGCPVIGDELYGGTFWLENAIQLHASCLKFRHPKSGEGMLVESGAPEEWA